MTEEPLSNMVVLQAKAGMEARVEAYLKELARGFRQAEGCLQYDCYQSFDNPTRFMLVIQWRDEPSLEQHFASNELQELFTTGTAELLESFAAADYLAFSRGAQEFDAV